MTQSWMLYLTPFLYLIAYAFIASVLTIAPKMLLFLRQRYAYTYILGHSLVAILVGFAIAYGNYRYTQPRLFEHEVSLLGIDPTLPIPFLISGIWIGTLRLYLAKYSKRPKRNE